MVPVNLIPLDIVDFDIILGTDWLFHNHALVDCRNKVVTFRRPSMHVVTLTGERRKLKHKLISAIKVKRMLRKGYEGFCHVLFEERNPLTFSVQLVKETSKATNVQLNKKQRTLV